MAKMITQFKDNLSERANSVRLILFIVLRKWASLTIITSQSTTGEKIYKLAIRSLEVTLQFLGQQTI